MWVYIVYTGWVKNKCDLRRLYQNCTFLVQLFCMVVFQYFLKICILFFWYSHGLKENPRTFFSLKIKSSEKQKCIHYLFISKSKILLRLNHRITESQKIRKIVIRKFAIFSSVLNFKEKLFKLSSSLFLSLFLITKYALNP